MLNDLRFATRSLLKHPAYAVVAIVTLALGIGANTALFSVADAVLFRPLPYAEPDRIVEIEAAPYRFTKTGMTASRTMEQSPVFAGVGMYASGGLNVGGGSQPERVPAAAVSAGFFDAMGTPPVLGRPLTVSEADANERVAIIGHDLWRRRFAGADVTGQTGLLNGQAYTIVGVMPPRYDFPNQAAVWVPPSADRQITGSAFAPRTVARLAPGVTRQQAREEVERIKYRGAPPDPRDRAVVITPLKEALTGTVRPLFGIIGIAAVLVLLVACINTTNLLLARVSAREREMSVRRALGASRRNLVRFLLCESAVLSLAAGALAVPIAIATLAAMRAVLPPTLHGVPHVAIDARAVAVTSALSLACTLLFGLAPALTVKGRALAGILRGGTATPGRAWRLFRGGLVAIEIAAGLILLAGAVTIANTVASLMRADLGVRGEHVLTLQLTLPMTRYDTAEKVAAFYQQLQERLRSLAGVTRAGVTTLMPGSREVGIGLRTDVQGLTPPAGDGSTILFVRASEDYFSSMGIDLVAGRFFGVADRAGSSPVAIVTEATARAVGTDPHQLLGRRIRAGFGDKPAYAEIVGVVRDVQVSGPEGRPGPQLYVPFGQSPGFGTLFVAVKTAGPPAALAADVRTALRGLDGDLPPYNVRTFDEIRASYLADRRFARAVMVAFAALTATLASIGLYGVVSYLVQLRTREIGIRVALGATPGRVLRSTLRSGLACSAAGVLCGAGATLLMSRLFLSQMPGLHQVSASTLGLASGVMLLLSTLTAWLPATRAARVNPVEALRLE